MCYEEKYRKFWKKSKEQETSPLSSRRRSEISSPKSRTKKVKLSKRDKVSQMYLRNSTKTCTKAKKKLLKKERTHVLKLTVKILTNTTPSQKLQKNEIQDAIDRLKKGRAKDSNGIRAEQLENCSDDTKEKSGQSSTQLRSRMTSHQKVGERSESRSFTKKKVTEKMQAITVQFVACQYYISCLPPYYALDSLLLCTEYILPTRRGFGPNIDVTITLWCTECWSSVVVSGVYHCTSARSTSRKHLIESNIQRYGVLCSSTVSSQHM